MAKQSVKVTAKEANTELLIAVTGLWSATAGSQVYKNKLWVLKKELERKVSEAYDELTPKEIEFSQKLSAGKAAAQAAGVEYVAADDMLDLQSKLYDLQRKCDKKEIVITSPLLKLDEFPSEEEIEKLQPYQRTTTNPTTGQTEYLPALPIVNLISIVSTTLIENSNE
jgi:hypothetical protein